MHCLTKLLPGVLETRKLAAGLQKNSKYSIFAYIRIKNWSKTWAILFTWTTSDPDGDWFSLNSRPKRAENTPG